MNLVPGSTPAWFLGSEILIQVIFAIVTLFIAVSAYGVHKVVKTRKTMLFGLGFLGVSAAYFIQAILNFLVLNQVQSADILGAAVTAVGGNQPILLSKLAVVLHMLLMVASFGILAYLTLKERGIKVLLLIWSLSLLSLVVAANYVFAFHAVMAIFLLFISAQYFQRFEKKPKVANFLPFAGFALIFSGFTLLAFATAIGILYVFGLLVTLAGYLVLLWNLFRVVR